MEHGQNYGTVIYVIIAFENDETDTAKSDTMDIDEDIEDNDEY